MSLRKSFLALLISLFVISNTAVAVMCARLQSVSGGEYHTLALMDDNTLWACGDNDYYQLGLGSSVDRSLSLKQVKGENGVGSLKNISAYDAGWYHSLAADSNGTLWAWGYDEQGQLGNGANQTNWDVPQKVHGVNDVGYLSDTVDVVYVSAGRSGTHSLAVGLDGHVYAFGYNDSGQCGNGTSGGQEDTPVLVHGESDIGYLGKITAADAGVSHSIALDNEGHVWHWGSGSNSIIYPEKVKALSTFGGQELSGIKQISSCGHSVAVDINGNVWEWSYSDSAYKVPGGEMLTTYLEDVCEVSAGEGYSMARTSEGYVLVWDNGQYAYPEYVEAGEMKTVSGLLEGIISIGAGYTHKTAICENGYGWAWGNNGDGKLGVGDTNNRDEPAQMLCAEASCSIYLTKTSEILGSEPYCVKPFIGMGVEDNYLVYDINYGNPITNPSDPNYYGSIYEVNIIDHLPLEVDFNSVTGGGQYDPNDRTVTWTIGELEPGEEGSFALTVKVNEYARPGGEVSNFVELTADMYYSYATDTVPVCNWGTEIIYVDQDANGYNNGTSWKDAYTDLRDAFTAAQNLSSEVTAIWVAEGIYQPIYDMDDEETYKNSTFELLENLGVFGHFGGVGTYETSTSQRNFADPNNETVLEGQIGQNYYDAVYHIVTAEDIDDAVLDGFTVKGSYSGAGVSLDNSDVAIVNCKLKSNDYYGVQAENYSYPDIHNCTFTDNSTSSVYSSTSQPDISYSILDGNDSGYYGLYMQSGSSIDVINSVFRNHEDYGVYGSNGTLTVDDSLFENNYEGLDISDVTTTLYGCSIKQSQYYGVWASNADLTVEHSVIHGTQYYNGIYMQNFSNLDLIGSVVRYSGDHGIYITQNSQTNIKNCWIHNNGNGSNDSGIYLDRPVESPLVRNNTIYDNYKYGIYMSENGGDPNIINCIIYANGTNDLYRVNDTFDTVNYCNLQNLHDGTGNITGDPGFKNPSDPNDLHISETSQCKDAGDPNGSYDESDIDGENRIYYGRVDIGADEYYWSPADFDEDGDVDLIDYATLANAWMTDLGNQDYNEDCDLEDNNSIDVNDLALFCEDWLWEKAWDEGWMMAMGGSGRMFSLESMSLMESNLSVESYEKIASKKSSDALILSTADSLRKRPERLLLKSQKFYDITPDKTISAKQRELAALKTKVDIKEILQWLDGIWLSGDLGEDMTYEQYLEFREAIKESASLY
jgi:parallel beta-helix repeat protein